MRGDMMLASTRLYMSSGKMNTSMSESVTAEDLRSRSRSFMRSPYTRSGIHDEVVILRHFLAFYE